MKIYNPDAYMAYENMIKGFNSDNLVYGYDSPINSQFIFGALTQAALKEKNPFAFGSKEAKLYFRLLYCYDIWKSGRIDARVHRIRMYRAAVELASLGLPNPFSKDIDPAADLPIELCSLEELANIELKKSLAEDIESQTFVPAINVDHIFGVQPDEEETL